jgi:hypothetical protein
MSLTVKGKNHAILGQHISWAGECPWTKGLCFGCEDGKLLILPADMGRREESIAEQKVASEAINGIAFVGDNVGITSRNEVIIGYRKDVKNLSLGAYEHTFRGGAHGIVGSSQDAFLAPIGVDGLLMVNLLAGHRISISIARNHEVPLNFYRLVRLGDGPAGEVFACAARTDGLLAASFADGTLAGPLIGHHFNGHDIVDVCPLNDPQFPLAAICLSRNRGLFFVQSVLENHAPVALSYRELKGTAYSLLSAQGHVFVLTDEEFSVLPGLATRFLRNEELVNEIQLTTMPTDASEIFLRNGESVLRLEDSIVVEIEISELLKDGANTDATVSRARYLPLDPGWGGIEELKLIPTPAA